MPTLTRQQKITFAEMRAAGVRGLLIYCSDYKGSHWTMISADRWDRMTSEAAHGTMSSTSIRLVSLMRRIFKLLAFAKP